MVERILAGGPHGPRLCETVGWRDGKRDLSHTSICQMGKLIANALRIKQQKTISSTLTFAALAT
jgi:hypothetical protein